MKIKKIQVAKWGIPKTKSKKYLPGPKAIFENYIWI